MPVFEKLEKKLSNRFVLLYCFDPCFIDENEKYSRKKRKKERDRDRDYSFCSR